MLRVRGELESELVLRFQQFTSPVMAKGVEDTVFYCFNRMIALNEVGGAPDRDGMTIDEFHECCARMQATYPFTMNTLTTHDTKRSEDVRARLAVLTEVPGRWRVSLNRWARANAQFKTRNFPDRNTEYFLYQTLIGAWPISKDRLWAYMEKAVREAKEQTNWTQQNREFEEALSDFIDKILSSQSFLAELEALISRVIEPGRINSLAQTLIKYTAPGVPDTYQGSELWDLRLVDPDNRGPVDYELRQSMLAEMERGIAVEEIMRRMDSGMPKLWVIYKALHLQAGTSRMFPREWDLCSFACRRSEEGTSGCLYARRASCGAGSTVESEAREELGGDNGESSPGTLDQHTHRRRIRRRPTSRADSAGAIPCRTSRQKSGLVMHLFEIWAPKAKKLKIKVDGMVYPMRGPDSQGWWRAEVNDAMPGSNYGYLIDDDETCYPDPRSAWQPNGVHAQSRIYDHKTFAWTDAEFQASPLAGSVIYELHAGTFTSEGTLDAAIQRLDYLVDLGITHVELLPVASFAGNHGWGYDGVALYSVHEPYGGPDALKRFVNAAHQRGLAVLLDVVYNHFGPVGNYTGKYAPYLTEAHHTPWGGAVNLEAGWSHQVRRFFCDNALMWLRDYHIDGLRLDAVHAFVDRSAIHFLEQLATEVEALRRTCRATWW